ncbi:MAG: hypothetical protein GY841_24110 [FCB group bacterium]|nr:hypothetical protein [FCB group bacterium]
MAATYTRPTDVPRWADNTANIATPSAAQKDAGHVFEAAPPSSFENWRTKLVGNWFKWLEERFDDGGTKDTLRINFPDSGDAGITAISSLITLKTDTSIEGKAVISQGSSITGTSTNYSGKGVTSVGASGADAGGSQTSEGVHATGGAATDNQKVSGTGLYAKGGSHGGTAGQVGRGIVVEAGTVAGSDEENAALKIVPQTLPTVGLQNGDIAYNSATHQFMGVENSVYVPFSSSSPSIVRKGVDYTATSADDFVIMDDTGLTLTLPITGIPIGKIFTAKNAIGNGSTANVTVDISGGTTNFDGGSNKGNIILLETDGDTMSCQWDGSSYWVLYLSSTGNTKSPV